MLGPCRKPEIEIESSLIKDYYYDFQLIFSL